MQLMIRILIYQPQLSRHNAIVIMTIVQYKYNVRNAYGYTNGSEWWIDGNNWGEGEHVGK